MAKNNQPAAKVQDPEPPINALETIGTNAVQGSIGQMFAEDASSGFENIGAGDYAIPFMAILQKGSPQVSRANAKFLKGAEPGKIFNTVTQEIFSGEDGIDFIPCGYDKSIVEWKSRETGGGLVGHHREGDPIIKKCAINARGQRVSPDTGNLFIDTAYHFGLVINSDGIPEWSVISMASTQLRTSRNWNTAMRRIILQGPKGPFVAPTYSHVYRLTTVGQTKDNFDWYGWKVEISRRLEDADFHIYKMAREFAKKVEDGSVRVSAPPQDFDTSAGSSEETPF